MTELTDPKLGEVVLDPACGTGGFLVDAIEHLRRKGIDSVAERDTLQQTIRGVEKKQLPHLLCTTNLVLHDVEVPAVAHDNTLSRPYTSYGPADRVDVVLTNPPFGGTEEDGVENNFPQKYRTRETADLFMALILRLLKKGGRAAVVLPDGFLFGEGVKTRLKEALFEEANLHTVVRLPNGVFAPYTGINTNLLFFEKGRPTEHVWFVEHPLPDGYKNYTKTKPILFEEFAYLFDWWGNRKETSWAWRVPMSKIREKGFNLDFSNPAQNQKESPRPQLVLSSISSSVQNVIRLKEHIADRIEHLALQAPRTKMGQLLTERKVRVGSPDADGLPLLGVSNEEGLHRSGRKRIADMSRYLIVEKGWFAYNPMRINVGSIGWAESEAQTGVISPDYVTFSCNDQIRPDFVYWLLKSRLGLNAIGQQTAGSVRARLYFSGLSDIELPVPSYSEQDVLVGLLRTCSDLRSELDRASADSDLLMQSMIEKALLSVETAEP